LKDKNSNSTNLTQTYMPMDSIIYHFIFMKLRAE